MTQSRAQACLLGLAIGDALGAPIEFYERGSQPKVTGFQAGGPHAVDPGEWTDDTAMALCLADSFLEKKKFDPKDQMDRYLRWAGHGENSTRDNAFDIGGTVAVALRVYQMGGPAFAGSKDPLTAGNGCIMRLAPVPIFYHNDREENWQRCIDSSRTTHQAPECLEATALFGDKLWLAINGKSKEELLATPPLHPLKEPKVQALANGEWRNKPGENIVGSGYVIESLEASLWCYAKNEDYESAVLEAVNLGLDADTTGAICGQLAGATYGLEGIPPKLQRDVYDSRRLLQLAADLWHQGPQPMPAP